MEITSFVLGMLTIVAAFISASIVAGLAKINKLEKQQEYLNSSLERTRSELYDAMKDDYNNVWRKFESTGRDITMVEKTIMNHIEQTKQQTEQKIFEHATASSRYIDSRIDKVVMKGTLDSSKQIING
jgi:predicted transcriptional regulator